MVMVNNIANIHNYSYEHSNWFFFFYYKNEHYL